PFGKLAVELLHRLRFGLDDERSGRLVLAVTPGARLGAVLGGLGLAVGGLGTLLADHGVAPEVAGVVGCWRAWSSAAMSRKSSRQARANRRTAPHIQNRRAIRCPR